MTRLNSDKATITAQTMPVTEKGRLVELARDVRSSDGSRKRHRR